MIRTIGHSNHPIERFVDLLKNAGVKLLVDVRSMPYSRRFPQFSRDALTRSLNAANIDYLWEGQALGGKPRAPRDTFEAGLSRVIQRSAGTSLCLMCAEKEPLDCHRTVLVSRRLAERGASIEHLRQVEREKLRLDEELQIARRIQQSLLPAALPVIPGLSVADLCEPAMEVGGDYYDCFRLNDDLICLSFGDVAGKGVPGALIMSRISSCVQNVMPFVHDPAEAIQKINNHMCSNMVGA